MYLCSVKNNEHDAYCVATVLINQLHTLPDAKPKDNEWTLAQLVNRRDLLVKDGIRFKNGLHEQISMAYPSYRVSSAGLYQALFGEHCVRNDEKQDGIPRTDSRRRTVIFLFKNSTKTCYNFFY